MRNLLSLRKLYENHMIHAIIISLERSEFLCLLRLEDKNPNIARLNENHPKQYFSLTPLHVDNFLYDRPFSASILCFKKNHFSSLKSNIFFKKKRVANVHKFIR